MQECSSKAAGDRWACVSDDAKANITERHDGEVDNNWAEIRGKAEARML